MLISFGTDPDKAVNRYVAEAVDALINGTAGSKQKRQNRSGVR